jgi:hypothetical protein
MRMAGGNVSMSWEQFNVLFSALHWLLNVRRNREALAECGQLAQAVATEEAALRVFGLGAGLPADAHLANPNRYQDPQDDPTLALKAKDWDTSVLKGGEGG